jgi:hypothetical protein
MYKVYKILGLSILIIFIMVTGVITLMKKNNQNKAETSPDHKDPLLRTRIYKVDTEIFIICKKIKTKIPDLTNYGLSWKLITSDCSPGSDNVYTIEAEVPVFFYTDDLQVKIKPGNDAGVVLIDIFSTSRVGKSDLGENRRHILDLLKVLDKEFGKLKND